MKCESVIISNSLEQHELLFDILLKKYSDKKIEFNKLVWYFFWTQKLFWFISAIILVGAIAYLNYLYTNKDISVLFRIGIVGLLVYVTGRYLGCKKIVKIAILNEVSEQLGPKKLIIEKDKLILETFKRSKFEYFNDLSLLYEDESVIIFRGTVNSFIIPKNDITKPFVKKIQNIIEEERKRKILGTC